MADGFGYGGFSGSPYPFWLSSPSSHPPASVPPFPTSHPVESYDPTSGRFDPMMFNGSYHRSPADWSNNPSYRENSRSQTPSSSFHADNSRPGNCGPRGEDYMFSLTGFHSSRESSSDFVPLLTENFSERQRLNMVPTYNNSATSAPGSSSLADMLNRNSQEPFYNPIIVPSGVYSSSNALDDKLPGRYPRGYESMNTVPGPRVEPYVCATDSIPSFPVSGLKTQSIFDGNQSGIHLGEGRLFNSDVCHHHAPVDVQSSLHDSSVEPVNFDALLEFGESTGHVKPLSENQDNQIVGSPGSRSPQFNIKYWSHFMESSEKPSAPTMFSMGKESLKTDDGDAQSAVNCKPTEDVQANQKPCELQEQMFDIMNREKKKKKTTTLLTDMGLKGSSSRSNADDVSTGQSPERHLCDQGDFPSPTCSPKISSVVNAMYNLSEVLVYECFNKGSGLKLEQLENLDKVVDNLTKCLKKITGNTTKAGVASLPTQAMHVSSPNVIDLNEASSSVVAKDLQGLNAKPLDSFGFKEPVDKKEMTQSIKNILASNFPDGEENHPQTLLYKNLWLETEAALCSTTCMARYHRIKNEIGSLELQNREISADASIFMQEPFLNPQKSVPIVNNVEQETTESLIKHGSNFGKNEVTTSHAAPESSIFNSDHVDAVLSLMSRSFFTGALEPNIHGNFKLDATSGMIPDAIQKESPESTTEDKHDDVIDRFQILKHLETKRKLKSQNCPVSDIDVTDLFQILNQQQTETQNCPETKVGVQGEDNLEASKMADIGRSCHASDVMDRFQILKRREAKQLKKSPNRLIMDSDSEADNDQPTSKTQKQNTRLCKINSQVETCVDTAPSASGKGNESPTSDWEHVLKDD